MKVSILDQAPISYGQSAREALLESTKLAQAGEKFGYHRYWIAEHHDLPGLACPAPEVMISYIGANTTNIRVGSGAILLPYYKPYKVAEVFHLLATLFPNRIDLGIGRAPGGSAEATNALSEQYLQQVWKMPSLLKDLLAFLNDRYETGNPYADLSAAPVPSIAPETWLLGTGKKSAALASEMGFNYAFGHFMAGADGAKLIQQYRRDFKPRSEEHKPEVILAVSAICAENNEKAEEIALSSLIWSLTQDKGVKKQGIPSIEAAKGYVLTESDQQQLVKLKQRIIIGDPVKVTSELLDLQHQYQADEIMILSSTYSPVDRIHSYRLIAKQFESIGKPLKAHS